jgi:exportin-1
MVQSVPVIFESVFQSTLAMITKNFEGEPFAPLRRVSLGASHLVRDVCGCRAGADFPDHRVQFFRLLQAINSNAFPALLRLSGPQFQLIMDAIIWAVKHLERTPAETGLKIVRPSPPALTASISHLL